MEAELKPRVLETFDRIAENYKKLRRLQDTQGEARHRGEAVAPAQERKSAALKDEIVVDVKSLHHDDNGTAALVVQAREQCIIKRLVDPPTFGL